MLNNWLSGIRKIIRFGSKPQYSRFHSTFCKHLCSYLIQSESFTIYIIMITQTTPLIWFASLNYFRSGVVRWSIPRENTEILYGDKGNKNGSTKRLGALIFFIDKTLFFYSTKDAKHVYLYLS